MDNNMGTLAFFKESIKNLKTVGTITRSSKFLCKGMIKHIDFSAAKVIVELGAGDGVITKHILENMSADCKLMTFEVNEKFYGQLNEIKDHRLIIVNDSAEKLEHYLNLHGLTEIDTVISAIPFVIIPEPTATNIVQTCKDNLMAGGNFVQMHYSLMAKKLYEKVFGDVDINWVPLNLPPAFVMVCENR